MKTSNYILIAFFTFLFGGIFVLFLTAKIDPRSSHNQKILSQEKPLESFSVVVAQSGADVFLINGDKTIIRQQYIEGDTLAFPTFEVRNDTLFVGKKPYKKDRFLLSSEIIYKKITGIEGKKESRIQLDIIPVDTFKISIDAGNFYCFGNTSGEIKKGVTINGTNHAHIQMNDQIITSLVLNLNNSELNIQNTTIQYLAGSLANKAMLLSYKSIEKINLETDSTSTYRLNK